MSLPKFFSLILVFPFAVAQAATINFDTLQPFNNYDPVPAGFGSTADVVVSYQSLNPDGTVAFPDVLLWNTGYANLNTAAFAHANGLLLNITMTAASPNNNVILNSFDVGAYPGPGNFTLNASDLRVVDGSNPASVLLDYAPLGNPYPVPGDVAHTFAPNVTARSISIILGTNWNIGINNIAFNTTTTIPIPLPTTLWLFSSGLAGLVVTARRKNGLRRCSEGALGATSSYEA